MKFPARLTFVLCLLAICAARAQNDSNVKSAKMLYLEEPRRSLTIYYPDDWKASDRRPALVIFRCRIPAQRKHFRKAGMVIVKPQTAPVNSGNLPAMSLEEIAAAAKPRDQVADTKSAIRYLRANAEKLGIDPQKIVATGTSGGGDLALQSHLNRDFEHPQDDRSLSCSPDVLVLYCPAFDGIDIWFVKAAMFQQRTKAEAPAFVPLLDRFVADAGEGFLKPLDHRAKLIELAAMLGREKGIEEPEIAKFQKILELFNERDWQLLHPVQDALKMSASRLLSSDRPLPPTLILFGDRDHLYAHQTAFVERAKELGLDFDAKIYPGAGHSFMMQPAFQEPSTLDVEAFLKRCDILPE